MNGIILSSNIENSNRKLNDRKLKLLNFKTDLKKVFSKKLKSKLFNYNNSQILKFIKKSTDSKNSQTIIKNYDYDLNTIKKQNPVPNNNLTEPLNSITNLKHINSSKDILPYKINHIHNRLKEQKKMVKILYKKSNSYKSINIQNSLNNKEKEIEPFFINKIKTNNIFKLKKKIIYHNNKSQNNYRYNRNLEKIGINFINNTKVINKSNKDITNNKENKESYTNNIYSTSQGNTFLNNYISKKPKKINKKTYFRNSILSANNKNNIIRTKPIIYSKENKKKTNWKNMIFNDLISNINNNIYQNGVSKNVELSENNSYFNQKVRISTLLNLYNKNSINYKNKSL